MADVYGIKPPTRDFTTRPIKLTDFDDQLGLELEARKAAGLYRSRKVLDSPQGARVEVAGKRCINFSSNDYLGLANHPAVLGAFKDAVDRYGVGSGASHLISGHSREHEALEEELADFTGRPRAILFSTGYMANMGVINALTNEQDRVLQDGLNHASLLDGGFLCRAHFERYPHGDSGTLRGRLARGDYRRNLIASDGVFSMDGDLVALPDLVELATEHSAWLMVDDAHGFGVLGDSGAGVLEHFALSCGQVPILMATLGKALGTFGAFVAGSAALVETLIQFARTYIYTTALPPAVAAAGRSSLAIVRSEGWRREYLRALIERFCRGAEQLDIPLLPSRTAIQPVLIGDDRKVVDVGQALIAEGYWVGAIRPPTVPKGGGRLRITLSAAHSEADVDGLLSALQRVLKKH